MAKRGVKSRGRKVAGTRKQRQVKRKRSAAGKKAAINKALAAAKRSAAAKTAGITKALSDTQRKVAAKWVWVARQLKRS